MTAPERYADPIYARLNPSEYSGWVSKVMRQTTTSRTVARMPVISAHDAVATFQSAGTYFRAATDGMDGSWFEVFSFSPTDNGDSAALRARPHVEEPSSRALPKR